MLDAVGVLEFLKKGRGLGFGDERGGCSAIGGDQSEGFGVVTDEAGHIGGAAVFEGL